MIPSCLLITHRYPGMPLPDPRGLHRQVTLALIEAGLGIALVRASVLGHTGRPGVTFRPAEGLSLARAIYLVHRKRATALVTDIKTMITDLNPG